VKQIASTLIFSFLIVATAAADADKTQRPPASLTELRQQLDAILQQTRTPGASVAIVHRDGPEWIAGLGMADIAADRAATANTLLASGYAVWTARRRVVRQGVYTHSLVATLALLIVTAYFAYWHIIGLRTWT